jgi:hypothetical protein
MTGSTPKKGRVADPGLAGIAPASGVIRWDPVSWSQGKARMLLLLVNSRPAASEVTLMPKYQMSVWVAVHGPDTKYWHRAMLGNLGMCTLQSSAHTVCHQVSTIGHFPDPTCGDKQAHRVQILNPGKCSHHHSCRAHPFYTPGCRAHPSACGNSRAGPVKPGRTAAGRRAGLSHVPHHSTSARPLG